MPGEPIPRFSATASSVPNRGRAWLAVMVVMAAACVALPARAQIDDEQFQRDLEALASHPSRIIGSEGYEKTAQYLREQIQSLPGVELKEHTYPMMVPVTRHARMVLPDGGTHDIHPFWPAQIRVNSTPPQGIRGRLVYVGEAAFDQIRPAELAGQIAVVEAAAERRWSQAAYFGAQAIIVVGTEQTTHVELRHQEIPLPVNIPRFYVPPGELADALRRDGISGEVTLQAQVVWQRVMARNFYALVQSPVLAAVNRLPETARWAVGASITPAPGGWTQTQPPAALMFSVPFESSGLVPDLASGAGQAVQAAAGLALLRDLSQRPLERPVVVFFGGGDSIQFQATRQMFMALSDVPATWRRELEALATQEQDVQRDLKRLHEILPNPRQLDITADRALITRIAKIVETDATLDQDQLFRLRMVRPEDHTPEVDEEIDRLEQRQIHLSALRFSLQQRPSELKDEMLASAVPYIEQTRGRLERLTVDYAERRRQLEERIDLYRWLAGRLHRNPDPDSRANNSRLIELLVAIDLSDNGVRVGPMYWGWFQRASNISHIQDYRDWFNRQERFFREGDPQGEWFGQIRQVVDLEPLGGARAPQSWIVAPMAVGSELAQAWGVPGMSMITLDDLRPLRDTPNDTLERLNMDVILRQLHGMNILFRQAWNDMRFRGPVELRWQRSGFEGQVVSTAPGRPVPDLPREGFLATYFYATHHRIPRMHWQPYLAGMRRTEVRECDAEGVYQFEGLPRLGAASLQTFSVQVYRIDPQSGAITAGSDLGARGDDVTTYVDLRHETNVMRNLVFNCTEFALVGLYDPRFLQDLGEVLPLDARRNAAPQKYNFLLAQQLMVGLVEPGTDLSLVFRYGRIGNRLLLINVQESAEAFGRGGRVRAEQAAVGFSVDQLNQRGPLSLLTARDFWRLDSMRLTEYRRAGVSSSLIDDLHRQARQQIEAAEAAYRDNRGADLVREANGAWANEARVYSAAQDMANDVIRAAIFLLLLCVPFAFCMERLLIGAPNIYKQITGIFVIFAIMTAALWSFHPAFKISASPLIIILAFAIILMSVVVIAVVYSKFDTELKRIRSGRGSAEGASFARASVLTSAVLLGIANMRKRKFRTALTAVTIVLITFAVLAFTSTTRYLDTTTLPTGVESSHPGLMLRQRGFRPMPPIVLDHLGVVMNERQLVQRWWNVNPGDPRDQFHLTVVTPPEPVALADASAAAASPAQPRIVAVQAVLGLSPGESRLSPIAEVIGQQRLARLEEGEQEIIYFSRAIADQLGVHEGARVKLGGIELEVAGIFDANDFDQRVLMLSGEPIAPLNYTAGALDAGGRRLTDQHAVEGLDLDMEGTAAELAGTYEHLPATQFVIVPAPISRMLPNAALRTLGVRLENYAEVKQVSDELSKRFAIALFAGFDDGVKMVAASNLASISGAGQVAIPLAIAGLIIFNTMMGSIAERKREIHVYTSLGLAPMHVGALFLAEAMTYGLIGAVFGYVIGQGAGTALLHLGWLGAVTLNYSGTSAMLTMGLILVIVLMSALVPARLASKLAAPSIERSWRVPLPKGDEIFALLPFTINKTAAEGALAYLAEYFDAHREGSIGKFSAGRVEVFTYEDEQGKKSRGLKTVIWLTPFDLGVRQHLMLLIHPGQFEDIYEVQVILQRLSGDDGSWYRMNRTFLTELRKQFLQWRSLSPQRMLQYIEESRQLFEQMEQEGQPGVLVGAGAEGGADGGRSETARMG